MKNLLIWIREEGYVLGTKGWYKKGSYRPWNPTQYYTEEQLIKLYERISDTNNLANN